MKDKYQAKRRMYGGAEESKNRKNVFPQSGLGSGLLRGAAKKMRKYNQRLKDI